MRSHKTKFKKEINAYTFKRIQKPGIPEGLREMTSHFNSIKKCVQNLSKQGDVYYDKQIENVKNPYKKKEVAVTLRNTFLRQWPLRSVD